MTQQLYIVGAGAIGMSLAVFLQAQGRTVKLIRAREDHGEEEILPMEIILEGRTLRQSVLVSSFSRQENFDGVIVLANKSFGNERIATALQHKAGASPVVVLQNGLNIEAPFMTGAIKNIYRCVLFSTSQVIGEHVVRFKPVAPSPIGVVKGDGTQLNNIVNLLDTTDFKFQAVDNIQPLIWKKVIANCVFNSICPLLDIDNGIFHRDETARNLAREVIDECVGVGRATGVVLDAEEVLETVLRISRSSDGQLISTLQDIRNKRPTEIESLNFAILKIALHFNKGEAVTKTKLLGELTKLKSALSL